MAKPKQNIDAFLEHYDTYLNEYQRGGRPKLAVHGLLNAQDEAGQKIVAMYKYFGCTTYGTLKQQVQHHYKIYEEIDQITLSLAGV